MFFHHGGGPTLPKIKQDKWKATKPTATSRFRSIVKHEQGRVKKETRLASGFLKKERRRDFFPQFFFKMAAILCKMSNIHCVFYCSNTQCINETFWSRHSDKSFRLFQLRSYKITFFIQEKEKTRAKLHLCTNAELFRH